MTTQRDILELIDDLRAQLGMAVILVTHDLGVIAGRTERVAVMYGGKIIEQAGTDELIGRPRHPYTEALFDALPELAGPAARSLYSIPGRPPDLTATTEGCSFAPRCRYVRDWCASHDPDPDGDYPGHTWPSFASSRSARSSSAASGPAAAGSRPVSAWAAGAAAAAGQPRQRPGVPPDDAAEPLLRVSGLVKDYRVAAGLLGRGQQAVSAVADVSFEAGHAARDFRAGRRVRFR